MSRIRNILVLAFAAVAATLLVACGGSSGETVTADDDPQAVLDRTFGDENAIQSATIDASVLAEMGGDAAGSFDASITGAVDGADQDVPDMDLSLSLAGSGEGEDIDFEAGIILTGDRGFVSIGGETYELDPGLLEQVKGQVGNAAQDPPSGGGEPETGGGLFGQFDLNQILANLENQGTTDVDGTETVHVSGTVDISEVAPQLEGLLGSANSLQGLGVGVPGAEELRQLQEAVGDVTFNIYSGTEDGLLRLMEVEIPVSEGGSEGAIQVSVNLSDVNQEQTIEAPADALPFSDLIGGIGSGLLGDLGIEDFGDLQDLGGLGSGFGGGSHGGSGGSQSDGGSMEGGSTGGGSPAVPDSVDDLLEGIPNAGQAQAVIQCLQDAVGSGVPTAEDIQNCQQQAQ